jgi:hypothetical protein
MEGHRKAWEYLRVLRRVEITSALVIPGGKDRSHALRWERTIELSIDCFICERTGRTTFLQWGCRAGDLLVRRAPRS